MRLKLRVAYDGRPFDGWQSQPGNNGVQDHLEHAFATLCGCAVRVHGSGRTDAGVHALGQVAHADVPRTGREPVRWAQALNGNLPPEIRVLDARGVPARFHARFSATGKTYRYRIWNAPTLHPHEIGRAWHVPSSFDREALRAVLECCLGRHDFAAFAVNRRGSAGRVDTVRTLSAAKFSRRGPLWVLSFTGNGFLYKMVRLLAGSAIQVARGRASQEWFVGLLDNRCGEKSNHCAPAEGLYLTRVQY